MKIIPGTYKLEELKKKTLNELLELYVLAETIIDAKLHDTDKMRESLKEGISGTTTKQKNKVLNKITKEEIESLKAVLKANEFNGAPIERV
jgi:predicted metal-dependent phosphotriesterase family hydrolase